MQLSRLRFTVRRAMVAVATVGIIIGIANMLRRRVSFLELAEAHASRVYDYGEGREETCLRDEIVDIDAKGQRRMKKRFAEYLDVLTDYYANLEHKYRYAASHPWLGVEPDPPHPVEYEF
jgi:hypothetical protein